MISKNRNYVQVGSFIYLLINFIPLLPSGAFFSDFNITLFMLNFSVMYAVNKKTNIFIQKIDIINKLIVIGPLAQ